MDRREVPVGVSNEELAQMPVAVRDLEALPGDYNGAVARALPASFAACKGRAQGGTLRRGPQHVGVGEATLERTVSDLLVRRAVILVLAPGLSGRHQGVD